MGEKQGHSVSERRGNSAQTGWDSFPRVLRAPAVSAAAPAPGVGGEGRNLGPGRCEGRDLLCPGVLGCVTAPDHSAFSLRRVLVSVMSDGV